MDLGYCGLGRMGNAMALHLIDLGHRLTVWNRNPEKTRATAERGAKVAASPQEVAAASEIVITSLTNDAAVDSVYNGRDGLLAGGAKGKLFIETSTIKPSSMQALDAKVRAAGAALVECPVGGTVGPAREGKLLGCGGGSEADYARAQPVLAQLCRRVERLGPIGAGSAFKLAINLPLVVYWEALGEALSLCRDAGIAPKLALEIMQESSGGANALKNRAPKLLMALEGGAKPEVGFDVDGMRKDIGTMLAVAEAMGVRLPLIETARRCYDEAASAGLGSSDASSMAAFRVAQAKRS
ncbi:MAG TPA: NAD(P)-dependent oxidoreductase [Alphaproteobacteria bacterium]|nr:NAD(P)-dependent oxidoreductase [Alphaproteobacteria bacterium]